MHSSSPQPKRLGKYEVNGTIAVGPRWRIYKGFDPTSQLQVALKAISKDVLERSGTFSQMRSELRAAGALEHPGIVRVYGYGEEAGIIYVVAHLGTSGASVWSESANSCRTFTRRLSP